MDYRCPRCGGALRAEGESLRCCATFPVVDGVPVLIDEATSVFTIADVLGGKSASFVPKRSRVRALLAKATAPPSRNVVARENYTRLAGLLGSGGRVLVVGGGLGGEGIEALAGRDVV